jgi:F-type H+-transporting ATPase subunit delta
MGALADRYARALFEIAEGEGRLDEVAGDLARIDESIGVSEDLRRLVRSPVIPAADKRRAMEALLERMETLELTRKFVGVVADNRRLPALSAICDSYRRRLAVQRGEVTAQVISARELSDSQRKAIGDSLQTTLGKRVTVEEQVDPGIIGGLIVRVGSRMIDGSIASKLQRLRFAMKGVE